MSPEEQHYDKSTALEIAAGAKLFNVTAEDEKVGKDILAQGQLKKCVTLNPLSSISGRRLSDNVLHKPPVMHLDWFSSSCLPHVFTSFFF